MEKYAIFLLSTLFNYGIDITAYFQNKKDGGHKIEREIIKENTGNISKGWDLIYKIQSFNISNNLGNVTHLYIYFACLFVCNQ